MRIFITGAAGFVGAQVARLASAGGDDVAVMVSSRKSAPRLAVLADRVQVLEGRLEETDRVLGFLKSFQPEACIHLAWYTEPGKYLTSDYNLNSLSASLILLKMLVETGCPHAVMVGTCAEYDITNQQLSEDSPTKPTTLYAATKYSMGMIGLQMLDEIKFAWARLFYLYGPDEDTRRLTPMLIRALLSGNSFPATLGEQIRDYLHVDDVARALLILAHQQRQGVYNVSSGEPVTIRKYMQTVEELTGQRGLIQFGRLPYRDWEPMYICGKNDKLSQLGWKPAYTLHSGLRQTVEWWKSQLESPSGEM